MRITTDHPQSSYGVPIFIDGKNPVNYVDGINWIKHKYGLTSATLAEKLGVSPRTVEDWCGGQMPSKTALLLMREIFKINP